MNEGINLISAERKRQIEKEGFDARHDDQHEVGDILWAAICYATPPKDREPHPVQFNDKQVPKEWPWDTDDWKPTPDDRIRELVKAGALIAAEIDRLIRIKRR